MSLTKEDLKAALREVIPPEDEIIVFYTGIWSFAYHFKEPVKTIPDLILDAIEVVVGEDRTLLIPAFCAGDFVRTRRFDLSLSLPKETGILSIRALQRGPYERTRQPLHSFLVKGPRTREALACKNSTSWGEDSVVGWMGENNARLCPLGLYWHEACSYFHRIEETLGSPYRYFKRFAGELYDNGQRIGTCQEVKYSYSLRVALDYDFSPIGHGLRNKLKCANPLIPLESAQTSEVDRVCMEAFERDPYAVVKNKEEVKAWVRTGKDDEIAAMRPEDKPPRV